MENNNKNNDDNKKQYGCFTKLVVRYPCLMMFISGSISIILCATLTQAQGLTIGGSWQNYNEKITKQVMSFYRINKLVGDTRAKDFGIEKYGTRICKAKQQSESIWRQDFSIYIRSKSKDVLSSENLKAHQYIINEWKKTIGWNSYCRLRNLTESDTECEEPLSFFRATEIDDIGSKQGMYIEYNIYES